MQNKKKKKVCKLLIENDAPKFYPVKYVYVLDIIEQFGIFVFERMKSERRILASKLQAEGEGDYNRMTAAAESERDRMLAEADGEAKRIMGEGDALAAKHYDVFNKHPELASFLKKLEALRVALKDRATIIVDPRTPPFDLLEKPEFLNLKEPTFANPGGAPEAEVTEKPGNVSSK